MAVTVAPMLTTTGWTLLPGLLSRDVVDQISQDIAPLRAERAVCGCDRPNNTLVPLRWNDTPVTAALSDPNVVETIRAASGEGDLRWTSAYLSLKDPYAGALWWHTDWWAWDHPVTWRRAAAQIAVLCYLQDTTSATGALRLLPGTHLQSNDLHATLPGAYADPATPDDPAHPAMADRPEQVTVEAHAGDAVILDYRLLHGTHPNLADQLRACLILNFAPDWASLPADVRAHLGRGLALPSSRAEAATASHLAPVLPPAEDSPLGDLPLSRYAPAAFTHNE